MDVPLALHVRQPLGPDVPPLSGRGAEGAFVGDGSWEGVLLLSAAATGCPGVLLEGVVIVVGDIAEKKKNIAKKSWQPRTRACSPTPW